MKATPLKSTISVSAFESLGNGDTTMHYEFNEHYAKVETQHKGKVLASVRYTPKRDRQKYESVLRQINRISA